ncbi:MAG TPA: hypothetical protein VHE35_09230 [Kofleriaceae bacterium]|nr:hypothetical protein [Kofleriaceae bacterium]
MKASGVALLGAVLAGGLLAPAVATAQPEDESDGAPPIHILTTEKQEQHEGPVEAESDPTRTYNFFHMHYGKDQYGGKFGDGVQGPHNEPEEPMSAPFAFALINFGILLVLLGKYGGPAARKMAETRSDEIKSALDEAAKLRQAAAAKLDEYSTKLKAAEAEMTSMLTNMRADAEVEKQRILAAAEAQAAAVQRDADLRIAAEIDRARTELAREVAVAAAAAAEKLLRERTTPADQVAMVDTFIKDVESAARGRAGVA